GVILGILVSLTLAAYLSFIPQNKAHPILPLSNECPTLETSSSPFTTTFPSLPYSSTNSFSNATVSSISRPEAEDESFHLSYMWISTLAMITCLIVGYFGSMVISCARGTSNKVPEIYLSPIRIRFSKMSKNAKEQSDKVQISKTEINGKPNEISVINLTCKTEYESNL
ncbi:uncharacterized protein NPIL_643161, partial [Nephila pilipes]